MAASQNNPSGNDAGRSPWLFFAMVGFIILAIVLFMVIRPVGSDSGSGASNPAATKVQ